MASGRSKGASSSSAFLSMALSALRTFFPFSARGLVFSGIAVILLASGLLRSDLASLFWGASFLLYMAYALLGSHFCLLLLRRARRREPDLPAVVLPGSGLSPGDRAEAHATAMLPRLLAPGFVVWFSLPLSWHERSEMSIACRLSPGRTDRRIPFRATRRGTYRSSAAVLEVRDVLGFTANRLGTPLAETLTVHPTVTRGQSWQLLTEGEDPAVVTRRRRRSEELLEVRKYYPGDDARRLNWKVFAHSRELFLRVGEETPPPESRLLFVLDATFNPLVPRQLRDEYLDALVNSCASAMDALIHERVAVLLCRPGARACRAYVMEERAELMAALADQWWSDRPWTPAFPAERHLHAAVFSTPGSPGLPSILSQLRDRAWSTSLFLKAPPGPSMPPTRLRDLLFIPSAVDGEQRRGQPSLKTRSILSEALARDLASYGSPGWKVRHVRQV